MEKQQSCQKREQLRTGLREKAAKLSEVGATSDRFRCKRRKAVRRESNFGQVQRKKQQSCQKREQLRTGLQAKEKKLSEERATSDRFEGKSRKAVRSGRNFGQLRGKKQKICQKIEQLRTGLQEKEKKLSEERATSDRFEGKSRKAVRRESNFGQLRGKKQKICQKIEQLRTGSEEKATKLSEAGATSDRFRGKSSKAV